MKILIVDDKAENRMVLEAKLKAAGYEVDWAPDGIEALRKLRSEHFGLIVTDLMMREMDGYQLTHAVKTDDALKGIPILVYTATYTDAKDEALAFNLGASGFILKPANDAEFFAEVQRLVQQAAKGALPQRNPTTEELVYLRAYTERLVRKLQDKVEEVQEAKDKLHEWNETLEHRVREATSELRQANDELEAFAYSVSHDLRSPLRSIQGLVSAVVSNSPPLTDPERRQLLQRAASLAVQGQVLINDLLEYSRLKSAELTLSPVSLAREVQAEIEKIESAELARTKIEIAPLTSMVLAHEATLGEVIHNLLTNAIKFVEPGTLPHIVISEERKNGWVRLNIKDNGIGIRPEFRERIFRVFERLHDNSTYKGTGVGLAIVHRAIRKMRGQVGVDANTPQGSIFWIELQRVG